MRHAGRPSKGTQRQIGRCFEIAEQKTKIKKAVNTQTWRHERRFQKPPPGESTSQAGWQAGRSAVHHFPAETNEDKYPLSPCPISPFKGAISGGKLTINRERGREKERTSVGPQKKTEKLNESLKARAIRRGCCALTNKRKRSFSVVGRRQLGGAFTLERAHAEQTE